MIMRVLMRVLRRTIWTLMRVREGSLAAKMHDHDHHNVQLIVVDGK